ncbi:MAG: hypothetical protein LBS81_03165 [Endomicrobium sp.]|jgi:sRNA-binding carbon storage regulator CsrA|nr:hypothetical protein [Endomicrobium sp.]
MELISINQNIVKYFSRRVGVFILILSIVLKITITVKKNSKKLRLDSYKNNELHNKEIHSIINYKEELANIKMN